MGIPDGSIAYLDLESPEIQPRTLLPSPIDYGDSSPLPSFAVEMDEDAPYLTFNIAFCPCSTQGYDVRPFQVWRATAVPDEYGRVVDLETTLLVSFQEEIGRDGALGSLSLRRDIIAYTWLAGGRTIIFDWTAAHGSKQWTYHCCSLPEVKLHAIGLSTCLVQLNCRQS